MELHYAERRLNVRKSIALLVMFGAFLMAHENCGERFILQRFRTNNRIRSPRLTASGQHDNVDKGSRQNRSVTSGKGLALRAGSIGLIHEAGVGLAGAGRGREAEIGPWSDPARGLVQFCGSAPRGCYPLRLSSNS